MRDLPPEVIRENLRKFLMNRASSGVLIGRFSANRPRCFRSGLALEISRKVQKGPRISKWKKSKLSPWERSGSWGYGASWRGSCVPHAGAQGKGRLVGFTLRATEPHTPPRPLHRPPGERTGRRPLGSPPQPQPKCFALPPSRLELLDRILFGLLLFHDGRHRESSLPRGQSTSGQ